MWSFARAFTTTPISRVVPSPWPRSCTEVDDDDSVLLPQPLSDGMLDNEDGTPASVAQMAKDVTEFLVRHLVVAVARCGRPGPLSQNTTSASAPVATPPSLQRQLAVPCVVSARRH